MANQPALSIVEAFEPAELVLQPIFWFIFSLSLSCEFEGVQPRGASWAGSCHPTPMCHQRDSLSHCGADGPLCVAFLPFGAAIQSGGSSPKW